MLGSNLVVFDTDALVGLINEKDALHGRCKAVQRYLNDNGFDVLVTIPIILEAATVLAKDKQILEPLLAKRLLRVYAKVGVPEGVDLEVGELVSEIYDPKTSKKNSPFDHYVLAVARENGIKCVFSFDKFYSKRGLKLVEELVEKKYS